MFECLKKWTNREIKFRGKLKTTGEWVYGDLARLQDGTVILVNSMNCILYKGELPK